MLTSARRRARRAVVLVVASVASIGAPALASEARTIVVGPNRSSIVEYDLDLQALVKYVGFRAPEDVTPLPDGTILVADPANAEILAMKRDGEIAWRMTFERRPSRVRPRAGGGLLVTTWDEVIALDARREREWRLEVPNVKAAVELANGNVLVVHNYHNGWLSEMTPQGEVVWRSKPPGYTDAAGHWVDEEKNRFFSSISGVDVAPDGRIFITDFDQNELRILSPRYDVLRSFFPMLRHFVDVRFGANQELVAASPEDLSVWLETPDGSQRRLQSTQRPTCATTSPWGTLWVGYEWMPEAAVMNATTLRDRAMPEVPWWRRALPLPSLATVVALLVAVVLRGPVWRAQRRERSGASSAEGLRAPGSRLPEDSNATPGAQSLEPGARGLPNNASDSPPDRWSAGRIVAIVLTLAAFAGGVSLAWWGIETLRSTGFTSRQWYFALGCAIAGVALRVLNRLAESSRSLTGFVAPERPAAAEGPRDWRRILLVALSAASLAACLAILSRFPDEQAAAVALWIQAQIWVLAAAYPPRAAAPEERAMSRTERWALVLILGVAVATRFWELGGYPDNIHHDHEIYGVTLLQTLRGAWKPFFIMDPYSAATYSRPWLVPALAALDVFGTHYWVLRLTAALWSVAMVWGAYLLARELFNPRVGLIAALLVAVNHALLIYSRQPYVIESTAPFLLALWAAAVAMRRSSRFHWCLAGVLSGWSMLSVRQCTVFPFIGAAIFGYLTIVHPRWMWLSRAGLLWLVLGAAAVYLPMLAGTIWDPNLVGRLSATSALTNPDGSLNWDAAVWAHQVGRSFGSILFYGDNSAWSIGTGQPICLGFEACLFGIGLAYLLLTWRSPATFVVLATIAIGVFLGSAVLISPPTFYHYFVAMVFIAFASAVSVDRLLALTDRWRLPFRAAALLGVAALLGLIGRTHLSAAWASVRRPPPAADGSVVRRGHSMFEVGRFIREHPEWRHYIVRKPFDVSAQSPNLQFAIADSDVSDITTDVADELPVPPPAPAAGLSFIVLTSRDEARSRIAEIYPEGRIEMLYADSASIWVYLVDAEQARRIYEARGAAAPAVRSK